MEAKLKDAFYRDTFSYHHNALRLAGQWNLDTDDPIKKKLYFAYQCLTFVFGLIVSGGGIADLYTSRTDLKKVVFNMCITMLTTGILLKNRHIMLHSKRLDKLRMNLFIDGLTSNHPEEKKLKDEFKKILITYRRIFYNACFSLLPLWLVSSLITVIWGPRALPFPVWMPGDLDNDLHYALGFLYQSFGACYIVATVIHADLAMFSIVLQIASQYKILAWKISSIDELYTGGRYSPGNGQGGKMDINKALVTHKTKQILRECVKKQLELISYVEELEYCYNFPMLIQVVAGFVLSIGNGLELIVVSMNFSLKLSYQVGYSTMIIGDVFMCCTLSDLLIDQGLEVVRSLYGIAWYDMDNDIRRDLNLIILRAQQIRPLTAGKMFRLNLTMFLEMMKNVYSWLALFRQVVMKK